MLPHRTPAQLLAIARQGLTEAADQPDGLRYSSAHLAALRAAAAVLGARAKPGPKARQVRSAWELLAEVAPELADWADHFAGTSQTRAAAEAGIPRVVTAREADDMLRAADTFVGVVESMLVLSR